MHGDCPSPVGPNPQRAKPSRQVSSAVASRYPVRAQPPFGSSVQLARIEGGPTLTYRILITDGMAEHGLELLRSQAEVVHSSDLSALGEYDAVIVRSRTQLRSADLKRSRPRLKVIGRAGVGVDNIDLEAAKTQGILVVNAPQAASSSVAELALGLILSLARHIPQASAAMKKGVWPKSELLGTLIQDKTLGIIGVGRIGTELARRALAMGMQVIGYDNRVLPDALLEVGVQPYPFTDLLAESDFISLHVPLTDRTRNMIDEGALARCKPHAYLISTARGGIVDEQALLEALNEGKLAGAALDVFFDEPPGLTPLIEHEKVITTPHLGAQTQEARENASRDIAQEVLAALQGQPLRWRVA